jgi:hypothetical protein
MCILHTGGTGRCLRARFKLYRVVVNNDAKQLVDSHFNKAISPSFPNFVSIRLTISVRSHLTSSHTYSSSIYAFANANEVLEYAKFGCW